MADAKIVKKCKKCKKTRYMYIAGDVNSYHCEDCLVNMHIQWQLEVYTDLDINR